jgi:hypothetical protein
MYNIAVWLVGAPRQSVPVPSAIPRAVRVVELVGEEDRQRGTQRQHRVHDDGDQEEGGDRQPRRRGARHGALGSVGLGGPRGAHRR